MRVRPGRVGQRLAALLREVHQPPCGLELPLKVVQVRMAHASIQLTVDRYGHLFPRGDDGGELAAAEKAFLGSSVIHGHKLSWSGL
jgi:hypothetical protein